jgi:hypothetical protein
VKPLALSGPRRTARCRLEPLNSFAGWIRTSIPAVVNQ